MLGIIGRKNNRTLNIIAGCSRLGASIAEVLSVNGNDVVVIDSDDIAFRKLTPEYSGFAIEGDATDIDVLKEAGADKAGCVIAVTDDDNVNITIAQIVKTIFNTPTVIARVYDQDKDALYDYLGIHTICPLKLSMQSLIKCMPEYVKLKKL